MSRLRRDRQSLPGGRFMKRRPHALINRRNYADTRRFLTYCAEVRHNGTATLRFVRTSLDHLLTWATSVPLTQAPALRPTLPRYLEETGSSVAYREKILLYTRRYFDWARSRLERYHGVDVDWIESLRAYDEPGAVTQREIFNLAEVRALAALTPRTLTEERTIAAVAFLFLSGMRVTAFATLPLQAIHWDREPVWLQQYPSLGVRTKNGKAGDTFLLGHPDLQDLRDLARAWGQKVYAAVGARGYFYAPLLGCGEFDLDPVVGEYRSGSVREYLEALCLRAGIDYLSPHKLRHGHAVWALKQCRTLDEFKAVSQNLMHESMAITDAIYGELVKEDVASRIQRLGTLPETREELLQLLASALFGREIGTS